MCHFYNFDLFEIICFVSQEKLRLRETEIKRVERLKSKENSSNAINNNQEVETEFEEASQKPKNNSFNDMNLHKSLMMVS